MGKDLKGKELGNGIVQRKDKKYYARFTGKNGKKYEKLFVSLNDAKKWLLESRYKDSHSSILKCPRATVDEWFDYWINNIVNDRAHNTLRNYNDRYRKNVSPCIGSMMIDEVKPMHCKLIFNKMEESGYAGSTIRQAYETLGTVFKSALHNGLILKHPFDTLKFTLPVKQPNDINFLTVSEQQKFADAIKGTSRYSEYVLMLETGLRVGEIIGLTWDNIDFENRTLTVNKSMEYRYSEGAWRAGPPKTVESYRTIPLTSKAILVLQELMEKSKTRKKSSLLSEVLPYRDSRNGKHCTLRMSELVFINPRTGEPTKNSSYDTHIDRMCQKAGIKHICMHSLRHTYATRAIERGVAPKVLQRLLGHKNLQTTMDKYVHVTDDSMRDATAKFESESQISW